MCYLLKYGGGRCVKQCRRSKIPISHEDRLEAFPFVREYSVFSFFSEWLSGLTHNECRFYKQYLGQKQPAISHSTNKFNLIWNVISNRLHATSLAAHLSIYRNTGGFWYNLGQMML